MDNRPNILFISIDASRADHFSCYNKVKNVTPNIDRIANNGVLFENAISTAPWTPMSHASMFTGMHQVKHGMREGNMFLSNRWRTLAEVLQDNGYHTVGIDGNPYLNSVSGLSRGHIDYSELWRKPRSISEYFSRTKSTIKAKMAGGGFLSIKMNEEVFNWLNKYNYEKPFYIFLQALEPHFAYRPPKRFKERYVKEFSAETNKMMNVIFSDYNLHNVKKVQLSSADLEHLYNLHTAELAYLDYKLEQIFSLLIKRGQFENTIIIITTDHGEAFGEHGVFGHQFLLTNSLLHVPLIFHLPGQIPSGKRIKNLVQTSDIFPTIIDMVGLNPELNTECMGVSLSSFEEQQYRDFAFAEYDSPVAKLKSFEKYENVDVANYNRDLKMIQDLEWKYIWSSEGKCELYKLNDDYEEQDNLFSTNRSKADEMEQRLFKWVEKYQVTDFEDEQGEEDQEILDSLRKLVYI